MKPIKGRSPQTLQEVNQNRIQERPRIPNAQDWCLADILRTALVG
jgi:hypothetical protein